MDNKEYSKIFSIFMTIFLINGIYSCLVVKANFLPVPTPSPAFIIRNDGSIDPASAPIQRNGETYSLTDNINNTTIAIERNNITLNGNGYKILGNFNSTGIFINNREGITVKNFEIRNHHVGIRILTDVFHERVTGNHTISGNTIMGNKYGISLTYTSNNTFKDNIINEK